MLDRRDTRLQNMPPEATSQDTRTLAGVLASAPIPENSDVSIDEGGQLSPRVGSGRKAAASLQLFMATQTPQLAPTQLEPVLDPVCKIQLLVKWLNRRMTPLHRQMSRQRSPFDLKPCCSTHQTH